MIMAADTYAMQLHAARVYLRESALRRGQPSGVYGDPPPGYSALDHFHERTKVANISESSGG